MSEISTATVETLTAEVRVLMVGSRQITLSVAKQLDWVDYALLEVFGRVRLTDETLLIGRAPNGSLSLAKLPPAPDYPIEISLINADYERITVCSALRATYSRYEGRFLVYYHELSYNGTLIYVPSNLTAPCKQHFHGFDDKSACSPPWSANGLEQDIEAEIANYNAALTKHQQYASLPLIVLAGLR